MHLKVSLAGVQKLRAESKERTFMCRLRSLYVDIWTHTAEERSFEEAKKWWLVVLLCTSFCRAFTVSSFDTGGGSVKSVSTRLFAYAPVEISVSVESQDAFSPKWPVNGLFRAVTSSERTRGSESRAFIRRQNKHRVFCGAEGHISYAFHNFHIL